MDDRRGGVRISDPASRRDFSALVQFFAVSRVSAARMVAAMVPKLRVTAGLDFGHDAQPEGRVGHERTGNATWNADRSGFDALLVQGKERVPGSSAVPHHH